MLIVNAPLLTDKVKDTLDGYDKEGISIRFVRRAGMRMEFEIDGIDGYDAVSFVKKVIRSYDWGNALYFSVAMEK